MHLLHGQFDLLHVELIRTLEAVPTTLPVPVVWDAVDCISQLYEQGGQAGSTQMLRIIGSSEGRRLRAYRYTQLQRFRQVLVTAERDRQALLAIAQDSKTLVPGQTSAEITVIPLGTSALFPSLRWRAASRDAHFFWQNEFSCQYRWCMLSG